MRRSTPPLNVHMGVGDQLPPCCVHAGWEVTAHCAGVHTPPAWVQSAWLPIAAQTVQHPGVGLACVPLSPSDAAQHAGPVAA